MDDLPSFIAFDANALVCLTGPDCERKAKLTHLFERIDARKGKAIVPTPAIAEYLVKTDHAGLEFVESLGRRSCLRVADFDMASAFEAANMDAAALGRGDKKDGSSSAWQKVKLDRQIVAIARANGAKLIVSDDSGVRESAARLGIKAIAIDDLELPDHARQAILPIE